MKFSLAVLAIGLQCVLFGTPQVAEAATSEIVLYEPIVTTEIDEEDGEEYEIFEEKVLQRLSDGGTYEIEFGREFDLWVESTLPVFGVEGMLYSVSEGATSSREFVKHLGGYNGSEKLMFSEAGIYELDVYELPPPILVEVPLLKRIFNVFVPAALAQVEEEGNFIETIRFRVTEAGAVAECCSSVLFLPGIKGSVLKRDDLIGSDTLWPPDEWSNDVEQLALTADGESVHEVYVDGILNEFSAFTRSEPVYSGFTDFMDDLVETGVVSDWMPFPYDWRLPVEKVIEDGVRTKDGVLDIVAEVEQLAADSETGQVIIVAHSMGGLLGKALMYTLEQQGKTHLVDAFVMVGSPQTGTPKSIAALLHGHDEGIPGVVGLFSFLNNSVVEPSAARSIAQHMTSSYMLLPSLQYFSDVLDPVVSFDESVSSTELWRSLWGSSVDTFAELDSFLSGTEDNRLDPNSDDLKSASVLDREILNDAADFHERYDSYTFPSHIRAVQLAGWGLPTMKAIKYTEEHGEPDYQAEFTKEGDGTVVYASAVSSAADTYYLNLETLNKSIGRSGRHKDLVSLSPVQDTLGKIIGEAEIEDIDFISDSKPQAENTDDILFVSVHSPVVLGASDAEGNYTGISIEEKTIVEEIPGSSFQLFGTNQYLFLPPEGVYEIEYQGIGIGSTTVRISEFVDDAIEEVAVFSNIETNESTKASFTLNAEAPEDSRIQLDTDGDGMRDETILKDGSGVTDDDDPLTISQLLADLKQKIEMIEDQRTQRKLTFSYEIIKRTSRQFSHPFLQRLIYASAENLLRKVEQKIEKQKKEKENKKKKHHRWRWGW